MIRDGEARAGIRSLSLWTICNFSLSEVSDNVILFVSHALLRIVNFLAK